MTLTTKILIILGAITVIGAIAFIVYRQQQIATQQTAIQTQMTSMQQLADGIIRSQSQWATKDDLTNFANQNNLNLATIQADLDKLNAQLSSITQTTVDSTGQTASNVGSTSTTPNPAPPPTTTPDPYGYLHNTQTLQLNEDFAGTTVPFGSVGFSAWQAKPWQYTIQPREYSLTTIVGTDDQQRQTIYNKFSIKVDNKDYDVKITNSQTLQQYPQAKFSWWNPRLYLGLNGAIGLSSLPVKGDMTPSVSLSVLSYGQYLNNPDWTFANVGVGWETVANRPAVVISPVNYNIGKLTGATGLIRNTYVGPTIQADTGGGVYLGAGLSVGF